MVLKLLLDLRELCAVALWARRQLICCIIKGYRRAAVVALVGALAGFLPSRWHFLTSSHPWLLALLSHQIER